MTQVEFYSVNADDHQTPYAHLCEVVKRAYRKGQKVFVHAENRKQAEAIDELLWTQDAKSFLPHQLADEDPDTYPPIEIGFGQDPKVRPDVLINLANEVPQFFSRFNWVFEYAYGNEETKEFARARFKFYRERGYPLNHRKI
ncbi:DNA polymerase III subunit chi [Aliikangiella marina]|uniref:DNA polymerase III subunit chi n=1 Tax=Aliikangiella marina TaxID=1712262 RepID=A0A545THT5_9GAMM|nr:DNA polymerase III subunit chi [Aliikangiella marina]TQV76768.1 DNA polymerase III subunit chi [Aliikangiella marina]